MFGLILLTALYIGMVVVLKIYSPVECLDDLCQSEAVDNTIINWASDFFIALYIFIFALQLSFCGGHRGEVRKMGILSQVFMGGAFVMAGLGNWLYPNSGVDDNHGMLAYWILWIGYAFFFTFSGLAMAHFAGSASKNANPDIKQSLCANNLLVLLCAFLLVLSLSGFFTGILWCSTEIDLQVKTAVEDFAPTDDIHVCFRIVNYSVVAMNFSYALLWVPVGVILLEAVSRQQPVVVLCLSTRIAAIFAMVTQWTVGSMLLVMLFFFDLVTPKLDYFGVWNAIYGTVLYHWAMLVTLYCLHNLSYGLPLSYYDGDEDENNEGSTPLSWEWWVSLVAWMVPDSKKTTNDGESQADKREETRSESTKSVHFLVEEEISV